MSVETAGASDTKRRRHRANPEVSEHPIKHAYWRADEFVATLLEEFEVALRAANAPAAREHFYVLASYYRRTLAIIHSAVEHRNDELAAAALHNLLPMLRALMRMHRDAPHSAPSSLALDSELHSRLNRDLVYRILFSSLHPVHASTVLQRFNALDLLADARPAAISNSLESLVATGHAIEHRGRYSVTHRPYHGVDLDRLGCEALFGAELHRKLGDFGFDSLSSILDRPEEFVRRVVELTNVMFDTAALFWDAVETLAALNLGIQSRMRWSHSPLADSFIPRPYQRLAHSVFRGFGYAGRVIEAPAGSGKTLIGMLCIEEWLQTLATGQTILVVVPTVNYQQQWLNELCFKPIGLGLSPDLVSVAKPAQLDRVRDRSAVVPAILVLTYAALAHLGSGVGKGGFDRNAIERFLQGNVIRHVILDEVHKVAEASDEVTADVVATFVDWLRDESLDSLIGFSGTVGPFKRRLEEIGLRLEHVVPLVDLVAQGYVAPFAEYGAPFSLSGRERNIAGLLDGYKQHLRQFLSLLGGPAFRALFREISIDDRIRYGLALGMYAGHRDAALRCEARVREWEAGGEIKLSEIRAVSILQLARGLSDKELAIACAGVGSESTLSEVRSAISRLAESLRTVLPPGSIRDRLERFAAGSSASGPKFDSEDLPHTPAGMKDLLSPTIAGLYLSLREWYRQVGEGRVAVIRAIVEAETSVRNVGGVIVFDAPGEIDWRDGVSSPGFHGVGGLFSQLLGDPSIIPMAALSTAAYLPDLKDDPLHVRVAGWIRRKVIFEELGSAVFSLATADSGLTVERLAVLREGFETIFDRYVRSLDQPAPLGLQQFTAAVLQPYRAWLHASQPGEGVKRVLAWMAADRAHLRSLIDAIFDYTRIAWMFQGAIAADIVQADGKQRGLRVIPLPSGERRQRFYDVIARVVDAQELPVNLVAVSSWARTGWNVIAPNVLIDATATRDATAWQQLRGRAMRPSLTWTAADQHRLQTIQEGRAENSTENAIHTVEDSATDLLLERNKVTHVYELLKARGAHDQIQLNKRTRQWERTDAISEKHRHEITVAPHDGRFVSGPEHAPLIVSIDPRKDEPESFRAELEKELARADRRIVRGWLRAAARDGNNSESSIDGV